jgi:hypothetical protein
VVAARRLASAVLCLVACLGLAGAARGATPPGPLDAGADGCQRNTVGIAFLQSPEWVYVHRDASEQTASGVVRVSHVSRDDGPATHAFHDYVANLAVDPRYRQLLAGAPGAGTGNYSPDAEEGGRLHFEWESGVVPSFAWPSDGDRATIFGSWIWDCGHWQEGGRVTGERTEFHPLSAIVVHRRAPYLPRGDESETDVFVSSDGTGAHAVEQCAGVLAPISPTQFGPDLRQCIQDPARRSQPVAGAYTFFVPAPPRPSGHPRLRYRVLARLPSTGGERVQRRATGLRVTVFPGSGGPTRYGKSFFVGWSTPQPRPTALRITVGDIRIRHGDPAMPATDPGPGAWNLYLEVNGFRKLLNDWAPGLARVRDGQRLAINRTITINVPHGQGLRLLTQGRECDIPYGKVVFGELVPVVAPCPASTEPVLALVNDDPGTVLDVYRSPAAALGRHVSRSAATVTGFAGSGPISFGDGRQGADDYELTYTVRRG